MIKMNKALSSKVSKMASSPFQCIDNVKVERQK